MAKATQGAGDETSSFYKAGLLRFRRTGWGSAAGGCCARGASPPSPSSSSTRATSWMQSLSLFGHRTNHCVGFRSGTARLWLVGNLEACECGCEFERRGLNLVRVVGLEPTDLCDSDCTLPLIDSPKAKF